MKVLEFQVLKKERKINPLPGGRRKETKILYWTGASSKTKIKIWR